MARERLTQRTKQADDPIQMSRDTKNPPVEKYMTGDPSTWAEDIYDKHLWEAENTPAGRTETGHPAEVKQSYGPSVKEAAIKQAKALKAKALKCVRIAESLLPRSTEASLEDQGMDLMELSDRAIEATLSRLAEMGQNEKYQEMKYETSDKPANDEKKASKKKADGVGSADSLEGENPSGEMGEHPAQAREEDDSEDDVMKEARSLLAQAKKLIAEAEGTHAETSPDTQNPSVMAKEEDDECDDEAFEEDEKDMTEAEKQANVLVKKARVLVSAYETEKRAPIAAILKKEAQGLLAQAKTILAGDDVKDDSVPPTLGADSGAEVTEKGQEAGKAAALEAKKAEAMKQLQAAKKVLADLGMADDDCAEDTSELPPALKENAEKMKGGGDVAAEGEESGEIEGTKDAEHPALAREEEKGDDDFELGMDGDEIDMMSGKSDGDVEALFMSPEMEEAKEAYEQAYGYEKGDEELAPVEEAPKMASKTASKKGAKTLKAGLKISSVDNAADELSKLWDCPPDVSHLFK